MLCPIKPSRDHNLRDLFLDSSLLTSFQFFPCLLNNELIYKLCFASGSLDSAEKTSVLSLRQRWVDKSPEPGMWFHHWVIIFYSSSRPTPLSSACNNNKSNQQGRTAQRKEKQHNSESGKDFHFSRTCLLLYGSSHHISALSSSSGEALSSWFVVAASVLFLSLDCFLFGFYENAAYNYSVLWFAKVWSCQVQGKNLHLWCFLSLYQLSGWWYRITAQG